MKTRQEWINHYEKCEIGKTVFFRGSPYEVITRHFTKFLGYALTIRQIGASNTFNVLQRDLDR